jgi:hydrogenase maturation factor
VNSNQIVRVAFARSKTKGRFLVSSSDPITGTTSDIGWYAVNVSANDVATSGIMPMVLDIIALLPKGTKKNQLLKMIADAKKAASRLGIEVAGCQSQITQGLKRPILVVTCVGSGNKFVTAAGARAFDTILMTKTAGIEGTSILSGLAKVRKEVGLSECMRGSRLIHNISILKEAKLAFETGRVHAMHDTTEGGTLGAVFEMGVASGKGFSIEGENIPVDKSTRWICKKISVDPLRLIGSGSLIISCATSSSSSIIRKLRSNGIGCAEIGKFLPLEEGRLIEEKGRRRVISESSIREELWRALRQYGNLS